MSVEVANESGTGVDEEALSQLARFVLARMSTIIARYGSSSGFLIIVPWPAMSVVSRSSSAMRPSAKLIQSSILPS